MTRSNPRRRAAACALVVSTLAAMFALPLRAHADRGTARLLSGGVVTGEIEVYIPGERVVIRTDSGEVLALDIRELTELQITPSRPVPPAPVPQPAPSGPADLEAPPGATYVIVPSYAGSATPYTQAPQGYQLQEPARQPPPGRRPSLFWPLMTLTGSAAAFVSGTMLLMTSYYTYDYCDSYYGSCGGSNPQRAGGIALMGLSLPLFILTATYLLPRKIRARRRHRAAEREYQLSLVPQADPRAGHYGATATLRF
jgi:hypothetical protein